MGKTVEIKTADGVCQALLFTPEGTGPWPGALLYMDAIGIRPAIHAIADTVAGRGYAVLVPDMYYRNAPYELNPATALQDPTEKAKLQKLREPLENIEKLFADQAAYVKALTSLSDARAPYATIGYCMGGRFALQTAAAHEKICAALSFHGAGLASAKPESPHLKAASMKGRIYIGVAGIDHHFDAAEEGRLAEALRAANVDHMIEIYPGAKHGFAVEGNAVYHPQAAARHYERIYEVLAGMTA
jgi:carboxymethylenebutenolidase